MPMRGCACACAGLRMWLHNYYFYCCSIDPVAVITGRCLVDDSGRSPDIPSSHSPIMRCTVRAPSVKYSVTPT